MYQAVSNHCSKDIKEASYSEIDQSLESLYGTQVLHWGEVKKFRSATMESGESVQKYFQRLKEIAKKCGFSDVEQQVRDQLVVGLPSAIFDKVCERPKDISLKDMLQACVAAEFKVQNVGHKHDEVAFHVNNRNYGRREQAGSERSVHRRLGPPPPPPSSKEKWKRKGCYRCLKSSHRASNCPYSEAKCNYCGIKGHIEVACRKKKTERTKNVADESAFSSSVVSSDDEDQQEQTGKKQTSQASEASNTSILTR